MKIPSETARRAGIAALVDHLQGARADLTPAEAFRAARFVPGWAVGRAVGAAHGTYVVDAGDGKGEKTMRRERLIPFLQQTWVPAALVELARFPSSTTSTQGQP